MNSADECYMHDKGNDEGYGTFSGSKADMLLAWKNLKDSFPWDVVLLLGGGFALADGVVVSPVDNSIQ